jgi:hypothetical protein
MSDYWIDVINGDDTTGDGSYALPYATPSKAMSLFSSSDHIKIKDNLSSVRSTIVANVTFTNDSDTLETSSDLTGSLSVGDIIGKSGAVGNGAEETYYMIEAIDASSITLEARYYGLSETVSSIRLISPTDAGTGADLPIFYLNRNVTGWTISGGWDSETTQNGETWLKSTSGHTDGDSYLVGGTSYYFTTATIDRINCPVYKIYDNQGRGITVENSTIQCYYQLFSNGDASLTTYNNCTITVASRQYMTYGTAFEFNNCYIYSNRSSYFHFGQSHRGHKFLNCKIKGVSYVGSFSYNYSWDFTGTEFWYCGNVFYRPLSESLFENFKAYNCSSVLNVNQRRGQILRNFEAHDCTRVINTQYGGGIWVSNFVVSGCTEQFLRDETAAISSSYVDVANGTITNINKDLIGWTSATANFNFYDLNIESPIYFNMYLGGIPSQRQVRGMATNIDGIDKFNAEGVYAGYTSVTKSTQYVSSPPGIALRNSSSLSYLYKDNSTVFMKKYLNDISSTIQIKFKYKMDAGWQTYDNNFRFTALLNGRVIKEWTEHALNSEDITVEWTELILNLDSALLFSTGLLELGAVCNMPSGYNFYIDEVTIQ